MSLERERGQERGPRPVVSLPPFSLLKAEEGAGKEIAALPKKRGRKKKLLPHVLVRKGGTGCAAAAAAAMDAAVSCCGGRAAAAAAAAELRRLQQPRSRFGSQRRGGWSWSCALEREDRERERDLHFSFRPSLSSGEQLCGVREARAASFLSLVASSSVLLLSLELRCCCLKKARRSFVLYLTFCARAWFRKAHEGRGEEAPGGGGEEKKDNQTRS